MSYVLSVVIVVLSQLEHLTVEAIWPWNNCAIGWLMSLIRAISNSWASAGSPFLYKKPAKMAKM